MLKIPKEYSYFKNFTRKHIKFLWGLASSGGKCLVKNGSALSGDCKVCPLSSNNHPNNISCVYLYPNPLPHVAKLLFNQQCPINLLLHEDRILTYILSNRN